MLSTHPAMKITKRLNSGRMWSMIPALMLTSFLAQPAGIQLKPPNSGWKVPSVGSLSRPMLQSLPAQPAGIQLAIVLLKMKP